MSDGPLVADYWRFLFLGHLAPRLRFDVVWGASWRTGKLMCSSNLVAQAVIDGTSDVTSAVGVSSLEGFLTMAIGARRVLDNLRRIASQNTDKQVRGWRKHWERGADARWSGTSNGVNPYRSGSSRASAWSAGWRWAERHIDRRKPDAVRLAHSYRRSSDTLVRLVRGANAGAVGVSALTMIAAVWEIRRRRARAK